MASPDTGRNLRARANGIVRCCAMWWAANTPSGLRGVQSILQHQQCLRNLCCPSTASAVEKLWGINGIVRIPLDCSTPTRLRRGREFEFLWVFKVSASQKARRCPRTSMGPTVINGTTLILAVLWKSHWCPRTPVRNTGTTGIMRYRRNGMMSGVRRCHPAFSEVGWTQPNLRPQRCWRSRQDRGAGNCSHCRGGAKGMARCQMFWTCPKDSSGSEGFERAEGIIWYHRNLGYPRCG